MNVKFDANNDCCEDCQLNCISIPSETWRIQFNLTYFDPAFFDLISLSASIAGKKMMDVNTYFYLLMDSVQIGQTQEILNPYRNCSCPSSTCDLPFYVSNNITRNGKIPYYQTGNSLSVIGVTTDMGLNVCLNSINLYFTFNQTSRTTTTTTTGGQVASVSWEVWTVLGCGIFLLLLCSGILAALCHVNRREEIEDLKKEFKESNYWPETRNDKNHKGDNAPLIKTNSTLIERDEMDLKEIIGKGSFGNVYRATWNELEVAVKTMILSKDKSRVEDFLKEVNVLQKLSHPNIVKFYGICVTQKQLCLIFEWLERGSLYSIIHDNGIELPWTRVRNFCCDISTGMEYLHSLKPPLIHRDMKTGNLLVSEDWSVKVCDFGLSRLLPDNNTTLTACGTPAWSAPELLQNEKYNESVDVYSFGIVMWEMMTRKIPYQGLDAYQIVFAVSRQQLRPPIPKQIEFPIQYITLMKQCWSDDPSNRPSFTSLLEFFKNEYSFISN
eukprot:TRINITY_DN8022_c0_g1_i1.p1 TRINITY_DN8022_c0_g1~~TRINITY_DN8022_c0_g1_i1.p1  ORF type:complete len:526 (+),score=76.20 TRINITY_DN8022_c0_g1_i1:90-1580(+)